MALVLQKKYFDRLRKHQNLYNSGLKKIIASVNYFHLLLLQL